MTVLKVSKLSIVNESDKDHCQLTINECMNLDCVKEFNYDDDQCSLERINNLYLLSKLQKFELTYDSEMDTINFSEFRNLKELSIVLSGDILNFFKNIGSNVN